MKKSDSPAPIIPMATIDNVAVSESYDTNRVRGCAHRRDLGLFPRVGWFYSVDFVQRSKRSSPALPKSEVYLGCFFSGAADPM